jgi:hypothetical protein
MPGVPLPPGRPLAGGLLDLPQLPGGGGGADFVPLLFPPASQLRRPPGGLGDLPLRRRSRSPDRGAHDARPRGAAGRSSGRRYAKRPWSSWASGRKSLPAAQTASTHHSPACLGCHAVAKPVLLRALAGVGLEGSLHVSLSIRRSWTPPSWSRSRSRGGRQPLSPEGQSCHARRAPPSATSGLLPGSSKDHSQGTRTRCTVPEAAGP